MRLSPTAIRLADERSKELLHGKSRKSPRNLCRLDGFVKDFEALEKMVVYRALYGERGLSRRVLMPDDGEEYVF